MRFIGLIEKPNVFSEYCLKKATTTFIERGCFDHANYCVNNMLIGKFFSDEIFSNKYMELIEGSASYINNLRGMSIIYNNAGVAYMVENKFDEAITLFDKGLNLPSIPLHRISIQVNKLIAQKLLGDRVNNDTIMNIVENSLQTIDIRYRYQLTNLLLNLMNMRKEDIEIKYHIQNILKQNDLIADKEILSSGPMSNLLNHLDLISSTTNDLPGLRGKFSKRYGFVPIIHHTWL